MRNLGKTKVKIEQKVRGKMVAKEESIVSQAEYCFGREK